MNIKPLLKHIFVINITKFEIVYSQIIQDKEQVELIIHNWNSLNRLFPLSLSNFWLHISFSQDICEGCSNNGPLELLSSPRPFLCLLFFLSLFMLSPEKKTNVKSTLQQYLSVVNNNKTHRYRTVQVTFLGLRFIRWADSHFELRNVKVCKKQNKAGYSHMCAWRLDRPILFFTPRSLSNKQKTTHST